MKKDSHHINKILEALANGDGRVRACKIANINYQTFLNWMNDNVEFLESVKKAEDAGNDKIKDICKRRIIEDKSWQSGAWWLERNFPGEFRQRTETETKIKSDVPIIQVTTQKAADALNELIGKENDE